MKRFLAFFLAIQITAMILTGCSIPFFGKSSEKPSDKSDSLDMIEFDQNTAGNGGKTADNGAVNGSTGGNVSDTTQGGSVSDGDDNNDTSVAGSVFEEDTDGIAGSAYTDNSSGYNVPEGAGDTTAAAGANMDDQTGHINPAGEVLDPYANAASSEYDGYDSNTGYDGAISNNEGNTGGSNSAWPSGTGVLAAQKAPADSFSEPRRPVTVYYQDDDGCIVPMTRWIQPQLGIARAAVSLAIDSPITREEAAYYGVYPIIPEDTRILGIDVRDGTAVIDFSRNLLNYGTAYSERNIVAAVVYTLTEFDTIDKVKILINGHTQGLLKYGTDLSAAIGREDLMINADLSSLSAGKDKVDVYYMKQANDGFTYPVPVSLEVDSEETDLLPESLVRQLLSVEPIGGIYSEMPEGVYLKDSYVKNGVLILDFSGEFLNYTGKSREDAILKQLAYTLRQCDGIRKISIMVEGHSAKLPEGTNVSAGLAIPVTINDVMDRG